MVSGGMRVFVSFCFILSCLSIFFTPQAHPFSLTKEELDYISSNNTIRFVSQTRYPPFEFIDKSGQHEGMILDVIRWLAVEIGFKPEFSHTSFQEAQQAVLTGKADVITSLFFSAKRNQTFEFSETLFKVPATIFVQRDRTDIGNLWDLNGKTIAMQKGDYAKEFLERKNIKFEILETDDFGQATDMVVAGEADAVIGDEQIVLYHIFSHRLMNRIKKIGKPLYTGHDCMAASKSNRLLIQILNKGIQEARSTGVLEKIEKKWLGIGIKSEEPWLADHIWTIAIIAGITLLFSLWVWGWNLRLQILVRRKTADIQSSQDALRKSEQKLNSILAASPVALSIGRKRKIVWVNESWVKMFGLEDENDHIGMATENLYASQVEYERVLNILYHNLDNNEINETDVKFKRKDGRSFDVHIRITYIDPADPELGVIVACSDISERKKTEKIIKDSEQRLAQIIDFLPDAIFVIDMNGKVVAWNRAIEDMTGIQAEDILGKDQSVYSQAFNDEKKPVLIDLVNNRNKINTDDFIYFKEERDMLIAESYHNTSRFRGVHLWSVARPLYDLKGNIVGAIESIRDITEIKRTQELLLETERFKAVADLAGGVAHNFNNLLQVIISGTQLSLMKLERGDAAAAGEKLEQILDSCKFGAETVKRLQDFAGIRPEDKKVEETVFNLSDVVRQAADLTKTWWETNPEREGIHINFDMKIGDNCLVKGKMNELFEVVVNLIKNAAEALSEGGDISVVTRIIGDQVLLEVRDTGIGISEKHLGRLFNPFFTTKMETGTGLGLATSRQIVKKHKGQILVESTEGRGTIFKVKLPLAIESSDQFNLNNPYQLNQELTILVIDDMRSMAALIRDGLAEYNQTVITSKSGREGLEIFKKTPVDIVLCDLSMPEMNGWQVGKEIKTICREQKKPKTPFIILTGWGGVDTEATKISDSGVDAIVEKPIDLPKLLELIRNIVAFRQ